MIVCGIDPGTFKSGVICFDTDIERVTYSSELRNEVVLSVLRQEGDFPAIDAYEWSHLFIENIESMGLAVGQSTFQTCFWIGRFIEAYEHGTGCSVHMVSRGDEKITICGASTYVNPETGKRKAVGDAEIRRALIERFPATGGGKTPQIGTKKQPGPLYGVTGHSWQALSVAITGLETIER
jgi:hypothetical protein